MDTISDILDYLIPKTLGLNRAHIADEVEQINYSAIFSQNDEEYKRLTTEASQLGSVVENTPTGPLFRLHKPFQTLAGSLWLLKIRKPDSTRPQRGDADFTLKDYDLFKKKYLKDVKHFKIIDRGNFEMMELRDPKFQVLSYFSNIPLTLQLGIE